VRSSCMVDDADYNIRFAEIVVIVLII
jgi:hypothetical protein